MSMPEGVYPTLEEFLDELHEAHAGERIRLHEFIHREFRPRDEHLQLPIKRPQPGGHVFCIWDPFYGRWRAFGYMTREPESQP